MLGISLLLVDDEVEFTEYLSKRLIKKGCNVTVANNGEEAIEVIKNGSFDVVVLDVMMPGMDGNQVLNEIKAIHSEVEVIMLTGHGTIDSAKDGIKQGAFDYLLKPTDMDTLVDTVEQAYEAKLKTVEEEMEKRISMAILCHGRHGKS